MTRQHSIHGSVALPQWGVIRAKGADAASFLHGQLTNDFEKLGIGHARLAGYCNVKGRLLASFIAWKEAPDEVLLVCSADLLAATLKRLSMFVMRAKCKLTDASAELNLFGLVGSPEQLEIGDLAPAAAWGRSQHGGATLIRLPDAQGLQRYLWANPAVVDVDQPAGPPYSESSTLTIEDWRWLEVQSGVAMISQATAEKFVPQMINFEIVGGVNFQKGCYPGQEIVARAQYRGTVKRRAFIYDTAGEVSAGQEVFSESDLSQPSGTVALAAPSPDGGSSAIIEMKLSAIDDVALHIGSADGPAIVRTALPYSLPGEAELRA
ncbi:folate-binding protein YgfZ [soil metagenome]